MPPQKPGFQAYVFQLIVGGLFGGLLGFGLFLRRGVNSTIQDVWLYVGGGAIVCAVLLILSKGTTNESGYTDSFIDDWQKVRLAVPIAGILCFAIGVNHTASVNLWLMPLLFVLFVLILQSILP